MHQHHGRRRQGMGAVALALTLLAPFAVIASGLTGNEPISTIAGTGAAGATGDGGAAIAATLRPRFLKTDSTGNVYVADPVHNTVRKITPGGAISRMAGNGTDGYAGDGGPATQAALSQPTGIALDAQGSLYIVDRLNHRIRKVSAANGLITTVAGNGSAGFAGDGGLATQARLSGPWAVAVGPDGSIYIADTDNQRIRKVDSSGVISTIAGNGVQVVGYAPAGDGGPALQASFGNVVDLALDPAGDLFVADVARQTVRRIDTAGTIRRYAGGGGLRAEGAPASSFQLASPFNIALDGDHNLYISELGSNSSYVRKVDPLSGQITTVAGSGTEGFSGDGGAARLALLHAPAGLTLDAAGNLYVADFNNNRVRKIGATVQTADLAVTKEAASASVRIGQEARYAIRVVNNGPHLATNVKVTDIPGVPFSRILPQAGWTCTPASVIPMACTLPALAGGAAAPTIEVTMATSVEGQVCNTVTVQADQADPVATNNLPPQTCVGVARRFALGEFVAFSTELTMLDAGSTVRSGAVGANTGRSGNGNQVEVLMRGPGTTLGASSFVLGDTVRLDGVAVSDVRANSPVQLANGATVGVQQAAGSLPVLTLPALQAANPDPAAAGDITVAAGQTRSLEPGRYRHVTVENGATLILRGFSQLAGLPAAAHGYDFASLLLKKSTARLLFSEPSSQLNPAFFRWGTTVRVQHRITAQAASIIGPHDAQGALKGSHILFHVGGSDIAATTPQNVLFAVNIGAGSTVRANIYAPHGTVLLKQGVTGTGAFIGKRVAGDAVVLKLESAF